MLFKPNYYLKKHYLPYLSNYIYIIDKYILNIQ